VGPRFDTALKLALARSPALATAVLGHCAIKVWLNVELPEVRNLRVDLLGRTEDGGLVHIEIQSGNDARMALRMAEYGLLIYDQHAKFPQQVVLYFGDEPMRMPAELIFSDFTYRYRLVDVRELDGDWLIESEAISDNMVGVLAGLRDPQQAVRRVLDKIAALSTGRRGPAFRQLRIISGMRPSMLEFVQQEARKMPILTDIREHPLFEQDYKRGLQKGLKSGEQRGLKKGLEKGLKKGLKKGLAEGVQQGERTVVRKLIEKRFGRVQASVKDRLASLSPAELEDLSVRLLDATSLEELLGSH
jgi:predicted transposase YdaD